MTPRRAELDRVTHCKNSILQIMGESGAAPGAALPADLAQLPPELALIVQAWPDLPEAVQAEILATVRQQVPEAQR